MFTVRRLSSARRNGHFRERGQKRVYSLKKEK